MYHDVTKQNLHSLSLLFSAQDLARDYACLRLGVEMQRQEALWERELCFNFPLF